jgi:hypothetical protein
LGTTDPVRDGGEVKITHMWAPCGGEGGGGGMKGFFFLLMELKDLEEKRGWLMMV